MAPSRSLRPQSSALPATGALPRPQSPRVTGPLCEFPSCVAGPGTLVIADPPAVLCFQLLLCPPVGGGSPSTPPHPRQPSRRAFWKGRKGNTQQSASQVQRLPALSRTLTAPPPSTGPSSGGLGPAPGRTPRGQPRQPPEVGWLRPTSSPVGGARWGAGVGQRLSVRHFERCPPCLGGMTATAHPVASALRSSPGGSPGTRRGAGKTDGRIGV